MKKNKKITICVCIVILLIILAIGYILIAKNYNKEENNNEIDNFKNNSIMYKEEASLDELKEEYKLTGPNELYEIQTEFDGRKAVVVKPEIDYKVAFAGLIKNNEPEFSEIDIIYNENYPQGNGIWIDADNRNIVTQYLNNTELLNNEYLVDENGFLRINKSDNETEADKIIEEEIKSNKLNVVSISGTCYMIDPVTGNVVRNPFEDLNSSQTYEYYENKNDRIIFITENTNKELTNDDILKSIIELLRY